MAEPQLQIEQRVSRLELAIKTLAALSGETNAKTIRQILDGDISGTPKANASP